MRGKRLRHGFHRAVGGITPAHAGKTKYKKYYGGEGRDHPRACGENIEAANESSRNGGSPPRMRGKRTAGRLHYRPEGITPAHAGKTA